MKKIILSFFMIILPFLGFSQINEGFEGATFPPTTPGNWAVLDNGVGTAVSWTETTDPTRVYSGLKAAIVDRENIGATNTSQDWLVSPQITVTANSQLRFYTRQTIVPDNGTTYEIRVSTNASQTNQAAYTTVQSWNDLTLNVSPLVYEEKIVSLAAYPAGTQLYIAFVKVNTQPAGPTTGDRWLIDDVKVVEQCLNPTALNVTNLASVSATLNWTNVGSATQWEVEVLPVASTPTGVGVVTGAPTYAATGLAPGTDYIFYVRSLCSGGVNSAWISLLFSTKPLGSICVSPIIIGSSTYSHSSDTILYGDEVDVPQGTGCAGGATNYLQGYEVFYSYTATTTENISVTMTPTNTNSSLFVYNGCANVGVTCLGTGIANTTNAPRVIPSLAVVAGQTYVFVISTNATTQSTPYTLVIQPVTCTPPAALNATNIGTATADLSWSNPTASTSWQVAVQPAGGSIPTGPGIIANTNVNFGVSGLTLGTAYQYWVRSDCGAGIFSPWAGPYLFNTNICEVVDQCTYTFRLESTTAQWSGARMEVRQNGYVIKTLGPQFTTGTLLNVPVTLCQNYPFELVWTVVGTVPNRVRISIINNAPFSQTIYTKPTTVLSLGQLYATSFNCSQAACLDPTNLTNTAITTTTANLGWTPNGSTLWDVYLVPTGSPAPTAASTATYPGVTTNPLAVTLLTQNTTYDFYVRAVCGVGNSNWSLVKTFTTLPTCLAPTTLTTTAITSSTVTVGWTNAGAATSWNCIALPCGSPAPTAASTGWVIAPTNPFVMTGLNAGTCYDFYVRGVCSVTDTGPWSAVKTATTLPGCGGGFFDTGGPTAGYANNENSVITICPTNPGDVVTVTFTSFNTEATWDGLYVFDGNSVAAPQIASANGAGNVPGGVAGSYWGTAIPGPFTSSSTDGCLTFRFRSDSSGSAPTYTGWTSNVTCGPPPPCAKPKLLTVSNITQTTAILGWNQPLNPNGSQATTWQVLVLPCGSPAPTATSTGWATATTNPYITTGLIPGTCYEYYVRASCSPTEVSLWGGPRSFTTLLINDECIGSILAPVNQNTNCLQTVLGTVNAATASPEANSCGATADNDDVWYHFTATSTTHHISLLGVNYASNPTGLQYTLYTGSCGAMTQFGGCVTATESNNTNGLTIGQTYYVRVYSTSTTVSTIQFELCIGTTQITCPTALPLCAISPVIIPNNVGVPTLPNPVSPYSTTSTTVGCLGSAPAPTFYYLTIPTNGNYTFFLEQNSNNTFTGTGLDVDFVAWGPYTSTSIACSTISTANAFPTGPSAFCSFSAAFTETFTVNGAIAGQVYVLMITNFSQDKGFVRITQTTGPIPSFCCPYTNFSYPGAFFCQNGANIFPTMQSGGTAGTFSSTPGLVINSVTGEINIGASALGSYTITNTILGAGSCTTSTSTWLIKISAPANATISYSAPAYCSNDTVIKTVTQTGTTGGSYYAVPAGLTINNTTGAINPSTSTPGNYTVNYAIASVAGCPTFLATTPVTITRLPVATFNYGTLPYCQNGGTASPTFTGGGVAGVFTSTTGLVINSTTGIVDLTSSTPGTYTVTNTILASGGCADVISTNTITITTLPIATFNYAGSPYCQNAGTASPTFTGGGVAGAFTSTAGLVINGATGDVDLAASTAGTYIVTNTIVAANGCPNVVETASITINVNPTASIASSDPDDTICSNDSATIIVTPINYTTGATYSWTLNGNPIAGTTNTVPVTTTGTYAVTITLNGCTNVTPLSLAFTVNPLPSFTLTGTNIVKCLNETATISVVPTNFSLTDPTITYTWSYNGTVDTSLTTSTINVTNYGTYSVAVNNLGCISTQQIVVTLDTTDIPIGTNGECVGINYILTASPVNGSFTPGTGNVTYVWTNASGTVVGTNADTFNVSEYVRNNPSTTFPSTFTVTITTIPEGCTDTQSFVVASSVCTIQKGISPNGDGDNETFDLRGLNVKQLEIFNRYGAKVYSFANYTNQWSGQSDKGQELPDGTYYYVIDQNNGETKTGWIYINK